MSEYYYHKGELTFNKDKAKHAFKELVSTEYGSNANEYAGLTLENNKISIDTINLGSYPLMFLQEFHDKLNTLIPDLSEKAYLEFYCYNDGYYKLTLDPTKSELVMTRIKSEDPHADDDVIKPGEEISIQYSEEDVLEELKDVLPNNSCAKVLDSYFDIVKKLLKRGDRVVTPLGILTKTKSQVVGEGDITVFYYSKEL